MTAAMKHMASNFAKLDKFKRVDFRRWQKKMHFLLSSMSVMYVLTTLMPEDGGDNPTVEQVEFRRWQKKMHLLLSSMSVVYVLTTPIPEDGENNTVDQIKRRSKWDNDDYVCRGLILNEPWDSLEAKYIAEDAQNVETSKELWNTLEAKYMAEDASKLDSHLRIEESLRVQDSDKPNGNNVVGPLVVNVIEHNNSSGYNDNKGKRKYHDTKEIVKIVTLETKPINQAQMVYGLTLEQLCMCVKIDDDDVAWWVDSGATVHVCKDRCWFKTYESLNDGSILHMRNESTTLVHERGCVDLSNQMFMLNIVNDNIASAFMSTFKLNDSILWHARLGHVHFKRMQDMSKDGLIPAFDMDTVRYIKSIGLSIEISLTFTL
nr:hypothetical protein [Tanacetum cinerariifolium]